MLAYQCERQNPNIISRNSVTIIAFSFVCCKFDKFFEIIGQKHGFLPNLSILDLLMNMGPESIFYL
ncbi:MAG: WbqC family protein [Prevotella sp.]|nr:WbqC family protein [Prevotella sp.]